MALTKHPWRVVEGRGVATDEWQVVGADDEMVFDCSFADWEGGGTPPEGENLAAILAAPAMLEMLREVRQFLHNRSPHKYKQIGVSNDHSDMLDKVDEVIRGATREEEG